MIPVAGALAACVCAGWLRLQLRSPEQVSVEVVSCRFREHQYSLEMEAELVLRNRPPIRGLAEEEVSEP